MDPGSMRNRPGIVTSARKKAAGPDACTCALVWFCRCEVEVAGFCLCALFAANKPKLFVGDDRPT